jgi:hypothetical protein
MKYAETISQALEETDRRIHYYTDLWLDEKDKEKREKYSKRIDYYQKVFYDLSTKLVKYMERKYAK